VAEDLSGDALAIHKEYLIRSIQCRMTDQCPYKDLFGAPGTGAHSYRFMGLAIVDVVLTVLAGFVVAWFFNWPVLYTVGGLFILGIVLHRVFCVQTTLDKLLFS